MSVFFSERRATLNEETSDYGTFSKEERDFEVDHIYVKNQDDVQKFGKRREIIQDILKLERRYHKVLEEYVRKLEVAKTYSREV